MCKGVKVYGPEKYRRGFDLEEKEIKPKNKRRQPSESNVHQDQNS